MSQQHGGGRNLPPDVNPETLSRLSPLRREALDDATRAALDEVLARPKGGTNLAGLQGPAGIWIRMPRFGRLMGEANRHLRTSISLPPALIEVAILATAREMDSQFEWTMHEPVAVEKGVPREVIDAIRHRRSLDGLPPGEAAIVQLARESVGQKKVSPATYARALAEFGEAGVLEIAALIGVYAMTAIVLATFDQQLHDGQAPLLA